MEPPAGSVGTPEINESINSAVAVVRCWLRVNPFLLDGAAQMGEHRGKWTQPGASSSNPLKPSTPSRLAAEVANQGQGTIPTWAHPSMLSCMSGSLPPPILAMCYPLNLLGPSPLPPPGGSRTSWPSGLKAPAKLSEQGRGLRTFQWRRCPVSAAIGPGPSTAFKAQLGCVCVC